MYVFDEEDGMFEEESAGGLQEPVGQENWASMTVVDLSQSSGSDREVSMRPCQERAHTKGKGSKKVRCTQLQGDIFGSYADALPHLEGSCWRGTDS